LALGLGCAVERGMSQSPVPDLVLAAPAAHNSMAAEVHTSWLDFWAAAKVAAHRTAAQPRGLSVPTLCFMACHISPFCRPACLGSDCGPPPCFGKAKRRRARYRSHCGPCRPCFCTAAGPDPTRYMVDWRRVMWYVTHALCSAACFGFGSSCPPWFVATK
jgi:hypothetical protein